MSITVSDASQILRIFMHLRTNPAKSSYLSKNPPLRILDLTSYQGTQVFRTETVALTLSPWKVLEFLSSKSESHQRLISPCYQLQGIWPQSNQSRSSSPNVLGLILLASPVRLLKRLCFISDMRTHIISFERVLRTRPHLISLATELPVCRGRYLAGRDK